MSLNEAPSGERVHIGFFGLRNAGKSSIVNAVTAQSVSVVSDVKGTTTDPVKKAMELLPIGPVLIIDTPGIDDEGELGLQRVERAKRVMAQTDIGVVVADATRGLTETDRKLCEMLKARKIPYIIAFNKSDLLTDVPKAAENEIYVSAKTGAGAELLKKRIAELKTAEKPQNPLLGDLIEKDDIIVLVTPIDAAAPKGRLILPQQQMLREILDNHAASVVVQTELLENALKMLTKKPKMVITDSQAFGAVSKIVPQDIMLTSFSILFARYKGELTAAVRGAAALRKLKNGDKVLISEGCTHHRQCGDIGTDKLPAWLKKYTESNLEFHFTSGGEFPEELSCFAVIIHCGACMLNRREMLSRSAAAAERNVPMTNYGIAIAEMHGILSRSLSPFPKIAKLLDE